MGPIFAQHFGALLLPIFSKFLITTYLQLQQVVGPKKRQFFCMRAQAWHRGENWH